MKNKTKQKIGIDLKNKNFINKILILIYLVFISLALVDISISLKHIRDNSNSYKTSLTLISDSLKDINKKAGEVMVGTGIIPAKEN